MRLEQNLHFFFPSLSSIQLPVILMQHGASCAQRTFKCKGNCVKVCYTVLYSLFSEMLSSPVGAQHQLRLD